MRSDSRLLEEDSLPDAAPWRAPGPHAERTLGLERDVVADSLLDSGAGDLDLDAHGRRDATPSSGAPGGRRRSHAVTAAASGLAVALALVVHSLTGGSAYRQAGAGDRVFGATRRTIPAGSTAPPPRFAAGAHTGRRRPARRRVSSISPTARISVGPRPVVAVSPSAAMARPTAEFGFEE